MKKWFLYALCVICVLTLAVAALRSEPKQSSLAAVTPDPQNASYTIDGYDVSLKGGQATAEAAPGSKSLITTRYVGSEIQADLNGDGKADRAFVLAQNLGGSGTFYYAVALMSTPQGYKSSDAFLLGDRVAPQQTMMSSNPAQKYVVVFSYADRKVGAPMTDQPSIQKSVFLKLDAHGRWGIVEPHFAGESR